MRFIRWTGAGEPEAGEYGFSARMGYYCITLIVASHVYGFCNLAMSEFSPLPPRSPPIFER